MLPKRNRVNIREFFTNTNKSVKKLYSKNLTLYSFVSDSKKSNISISKKVSKRAVKRNRIKRIIFQELQTNWLNSPTLSSLVIVINRPMGTTTEQDLKVEINELLRKVQQ